MRGETHGPVRIVEFEPGWDVECEGHGWSKAEPQRCHCRRRFWPAALVGEIPPSVPVTAVSLDGEQALTIIIIGGMLRMRRRS
jgi:hypothetical protein